MSDQWAVYLGLRELTRLIGFPSRMAVSDMVFRSALTDSGVRKRRARGRFAQGVYIQAGELEAALRERDVVVPPSDLDAHILRHGGQRLDYRALNRLLKAMHLSERPVEYFLPELSYQRIRQSRRG